MLIATLKNEPQPRISIERCAALLDMTPDVLRSVIHAQNFPMSAVCGYGPTMMIDAHQLAAELEDRQRKAWDTAGDVLKPVLIQ